jgi:hypothetical protein
MADPIDPKTHWVGARPKRHKVFPLAKPESVRSQVRGVIGHKLEVMVRDEGIAAYRARQAEMKALTAKFVQSPKKKSKERWAKHQK